VTDRRKSSIKERKSICAIKDNKIGNKKLLMARSDKICRKIYK